MNPVIRKSVLIFAAIYPMLCFSANAIKIVFVGPSRSGKTIVLKVLENPATIAPAMSLFVGTIEPLRRSFSINGHRIDAMDTPGLFEYVMNGDGRGNQQLLNSVSREIANFAPGEHVEVIFCASVQTGISSSAVDSLMLYRAMFQSLVEQRTIPSFRFTILITRRESHGFASEGNTSLRSQMLQHPRFQEFIPSSTLTTTLQGSDIFFSGCLDVNSFDVLGTSNEWMWDYADCVQDVLRYRSALLERLGVDVRTLEPEVRNYFKALMQEKKKKEEDRDYGRIRALYLETTRIPEIRMANALHFLMIERRTRGNGRATMPAQLRRMIVERFFGVRVAEPQQMQPRQQQEPRILVQIGNNVVEFQPRPQNQLSLIQNNDVGGGNQGNMAETHNDVIEDNNEEIGEILMVGTHNDVIEDNNDRSHIIEAYNGGFQENNHNLHENQNVRPVRGNGVFQFVLQRPQHVIGGIVLFLATIYGGGSWLNWF